MSPSAPASAEGVYVLSFDPVLCFSLDFLVWRHTNQTTATTAQSKAKPPTALPAIAPIGIERDRAWDVTVPEVAADVSLEVGDMVEEDTDEDVEEDAPSTGGYGSISVAFMGSLDSKAAKKYMSGQPLCSQALTEQHPKKASGCVILQV